MQRSHQRSLQTAIEIVTKAGGNPISESADKSEFSCISRACEKCNLGSGSRVRELTCCTVAVCVVPDAIAAPVGARGGGCAREANGIRAISQLVENCTHRQSMQEARSGREFERVRAHRAVVSRPWGGVRAQLIGCSRRGRLPVRGADRFRAISRRVENCTHRQSMQEARSGREFERVRAHRAVVSRPWGGVRAQLIGCSRRGRLPVRGADRFRAISHRVSSRQTARAHLSVDQDLCHLRDHLAPRKRRIPAPVRCNDDQLVLGVALW